ncbi:MAG: amidohydrolase [Rhodobacteraceae bacterium]|nr:amidohydrolase [Paracoccaceae bacterium]
MANAQTIFTGGNLLTMDPARPRASAMAVAEGRILAVGSDADIRALAGPGTREERLHGRFVMPGLVDSHVHAIWGGLRDLFEVYVGYGADTPRLLEAVRARAEALPPGSWIFGGPWRADMRGEMGPRPSELLDAVAPAHPVALRDASQHSMWCNSAALAAAGIGPGWTDPKGGHAERDEDGAPTGILHEAAMGPVAAHLGHSPDQMARATAYCIEVLNRYGYTAFKEPMAYEAELAAYADADRRGRLTLHAAAHITRFSPLGDALSPDEMDRLRALYATDNLRTGFAKLFLDGVGPSRTASFLEPYAPAPGYDPSSHVPDATLLIAPEELAEIVIDLDRRGYVIKTHTVGDNAARKMLDAIAAARRANGPSGLRHELAHCNYIHPDDRPRFAELGAVAEVSPKLWGPNAMTPGQIAVMGEERLRQNHPIRSLMDAGAQMSVGTDWPAAAPDANPWTGLAMMLTRTDPTGRYPGAIAPDQAISLARALPLYTTGGARTLGMEGKTGVLGAGAWADFIVLPQDLTVMAPAEIAGIEVTQTVWKGEVVHAT